MPCGCYHSRIHCQALAGGELVQSGSRVGSYSRARSGLSDLATIYSPEQQHPPRTIVLEKTPLPFLSLTPPSLSERAISARPAQPNASSSAQLCRPRSTKANHCLSEGKLARMHFLWLRGQRRSESLAVTARIAVPLASASSMMPLI